MNVGSTSYPTSVAESLLRLKKGNNNESTSAKTKNQANDLYYRID